ncbi:hypothetical protein GCM10027298_08380 [Epidermidibacterium keratini]
MSAWVEQAEERGRLRWVEQAKERARLRWVEQAEERARLRWVEQAEVRGRLSRPRDLETSKPLRKHAGDPESTGGATLGGRAAKER